MTNALTISAACVVLAIALVSIAGCTSSNSPKSPDNSHADSRAKLTGTLRSGVMAIGGESTGWILEGASADQKTGPVEIDITNVADLARKWDGTRVRITGDWITKKYIERGDTRILIARTIDPEM